MLNNLNELHEFLFEKCPYLSWIDGKYYYSAKFNKLVLLFEKETGLVYVDNKATFNKRSQCPIALRLPLNEGRLLEALAFARTKYFIRCSNEFTDIPRFNDINNRRSDGYFGIQERFKYVEPRVKQVFIR